MMGNTGIGLARGDGEYTPARKDPLRRVFGIARRLPLESQAQYCTEPGMSALINSGHSTAPNLGNSDIRFRPHAVGQKESE